MRWLKLTGLLGWLVWSVAHIYYLIGFRNRIIVTGSRIEDMAQHVHGRATQG